MANVLQGTSSTLESLQRRTSMTLEQLQRSTNETLTALSSGWARVVAFNFKARLGAVTPEVAGDCWMCPLRDF